MTQTIEERVAQAWAWEQRIAKIRARTGGEQMHPDHYDFRQALRDAVLEAMDATSAEHGMDKVLDKDLPALFPAIDALAERLWLRTLNLSE
jgi:hypothetical protein